jgi:hypothetical protein
LLVYRQRMKFGFSIVLEAVYPSPIAWYFRPITNN